MPSTPFRSLLQACLGIAALLPAASPLPAQEALYRQTFGNDQPETLSLYHESIGWELLYTTNQHPEIQNGEALHPFYAGASITEGCPQDLENTHATATLSQTHGFLSIRNGKNTFYTILAYTRHLPASLQSGQLQTVEWYAGASASSTLRAALQISDQWYVSEPVTPKTLADSSSIFVNQAQRHHLLVADVSWYALSAEEGAPFVIREEATPLPADTPIAAAGLMIHPNPTESRFVWVDSFALLGTHPH